MNKALAAAQNILDMSNSYLRQSGVPLHSIFSLIGNEKNKPSYLAAQRFRLDQETLFARQNGVTPPATDLFQTYQQQVNNLTSNGQLRLEQHMSLLYDYGWALPSKEEAVSLYDKVRTEAAIAAAQADGTQQVCLVGGDISGIQDFIYRIAPAKAAKSLRARSMYLQVLTDALAHYIRSTLDMPLTNLLYSGGGRFFLILPQAAEAKLAMWRKQLGEFLLATHQGEIYIALGSTTFDPATTKDAKKLWRKVNESIIDDKQQRFAALDVATLVDTVFAARGQVESKNNPAVCGICRGLIQNLHDTKEVDSDGNAIYYCRLCKSLVELGQTLTRADVMVMSERPADLTRFSLPANGVQERYAYQEILRALGVVVGFSESKVGTQVAQQRLFLLTAQSIAEIDQYREQYPQASVHIRPMVNVVARADNDDILEFDRLTDASTGIKRLGVLRMDVDDLGDIFSFSIKENTLARISALSSALGRFFEGWVGVLCQEINRTAPAEQGVYSVYSGGDDVFMVGSWNLMPQLATMISSDLQAYSSHNGLHVSAGLSLHHAKYPLYQAARESEHALDAAKYMPGKACFSFLDQVIKWDYLGALGAHVPLGSNPETIHAHQLSVWALVNDLNDLMSHAEAALPRATLQVLQELYSQYSQSLQHNERQSKPTKSSQSPDQPPQIPYGPWMWRGEYQLTRMYERARKDSAARHVLNVLRKNMKRHLDNTESLNGQRLIERYGLAARWVQLLQRKENRHGDE